MARNASTSRRANAPAPTSQPTRQRTSRRAGATPATPRPHHPANPVLKPRPKRLTHDRGLNPPDDTPTYATATGGSSSAEMRTRHRDRSVESHGYEQLARRCCLSTDAGALGPRPHLADASATRLLQAHSVPRDQRRIKVGSTFAHPLAPGSGDAGGEEAEIVGERAVGEVGDACAQDGDRLGR
jgi:hypothetical protein